MSSFLTNSSQSIAGNSFSSFITGSVDSGMPAVLKTAALQQQQQQQQLTDDQIASAAIDRTKLKTKICRNWQSGVSCPYGDRCAFAHGDVERVSKAAARNQASSVSRTTSKVSVTATPTNPPMKPLQGNLASVFGSPMMGTPQANHLGTPQANHFVRTPSERSLQGSVPVQPLMPPATLTTPLVNSTTSFGQSQSAFHTPVLSQLTRVQTPTQSPMPDVKSPGMESLNNASFNSTVFRYDPYSAESAQVVLSTPTPTPLMPMVLPPATDALESSSPTSNSSRNTDEARSAGSLSPAKRSDSTGSFDELNMPPSPPAQGRFLSPPARLRHRRDTTPSEQMLSVEEAASADGERRMRRSSTPTTGTMYVR
eukprot:TRINITY_DN280_c1_g1_i3.p2 TRINITY_DN280_c1_g1~~TRINITY_DN280_c1_g1_i3.p2  ORF type:complete len:368 (+),score=153.63 TRINITY_DN280_c1_g1_i3:60-1163(+)